MRTVSRSVRARRSVLDGRAKATLLVLCGASFLDSVDISMVSVALPRIGSGLDMSTSSLQWVLGGYARSDTTDS